MSEEGTIPTAGEALNGARAVDLLKTAEKRRESREKTLFLDIPSWDGSLVGEYKIVPGAVLSRLAEKALRRFRQGDEESGLQGDIDLIAVACVGLYARDPETGERVPIEDENGLVGYNRIATVLGKEEEIKSNSDAVRYLTAERNDNGGWQTNAVAIGAHAEIISKWMRDPSRRTISAEDILGES